MYDLASLKATVDRILSVAGFVAKFTPNKVDDHVIAVLQGLASNEDLLNLFLTLINSLDKNKIQDTQYVVQKFDTLMNA